MSGRDVIADAIRIEAEQDLIAAYDAESVTARILSALAAAGYAVVPVEPTEAMRKAAFGPVLHGGKCGPLTADFIRQEAALSVYRAMLAATGKEPAR